MLWLFSPGSQVPPTPPHTNFSIFVFFLHTNFSGCHVGRPQVLSLIIFFSYKSCVFVCLLFVCLLSSLFCIFFFCFHPTEIYCNFIQAFRRIIMATNDTKSRIPLLVHYTILSYLRRGYLHHGEKKCPQ